MAGALFFVSNTQEGEGLIVPGNERHARLFELSTCMYA